MNPKSALCLFLLFATTVPISAVADEFLLPISANGLAGGYGTFWRANLIVLNRGEELAFIDIDRVCSPAGLCPDALSVSPGEWHTTGLEGRGRGHLVRVVEGTPEFSYRLYVSDSLVELGRVLMELPIIPVDSLGSDPLALFKIDLPMETRHALRIYDLSTVPNPTVRITATYMFGNVVFFDQEVTLQGRDDLHPAEATLFDFLPSPDSDILLTVRPLNPEMRVWAFLSVTDNLTQDLVLYTPQTPRNTCD
jgi:hypothetical protein